MGSVLAALNAGNNVEIIVINTEIINTNNTSSYFISEGNVDKKYISSAKSSVPNKYSRRNCIK